jgi:hypothetical protein
MGDEWLGLAFQEGKEVLAGETQNALEKAVEVGFSAS